MFKKFIKVLLVSVALFSTNINAVEIKRPNLLVSPEAGKVKLFHEDGKFYVLNDCEYTSVQNAFVDKEIRNLSSVELGYFLGSIKEIEVNGEIQTLYKISEKEFANLVIPAVVNPIEFTLSQEVASSINSYNSIVITKLSNGEYCLHAHVNGHGGGFITGAVVYWGIKTFAYGGIAASVGTITVATGGVAGAAIGGAAVATTAGISTGAAIAGGAIAGAGLATEAAVVTTGAITLAGGVAATIAAVESTAAGAGVFFTLIPWLP